MEMTRNKIFKTALQANAYCIFTQNEREKEREPFCTVDVLKQRKFNPENI